MKKTPAKQVNTSSAKKDSKAPIIEAPRNLTTWSVVAFFVVTTLIFFWDNIFGNAFFWEDFVEYVYPTQSFAASSSGIPFWNPFTFNGMPFFGDAQVGFFYPFNRLLDLFVGSNGTLPVGVAQMVIILHFFIAQLSMYFLARSFKISSLSSILTSVSYAFSMLMICHVIHPMMIYHLSWFPLIVMFLIKGLNEANIRYGAIAGLLMGMTMLSGHPQTMLYEMMFLGLIVVWYLVADIRKKEFAKKSAVKFVVSGLALFIIAAGLFTVQLLPTNELAGYSQREQITYEKSSEGSLQFKQVYSAVVPKIFGYVNPGNDKEYAQFYLQFKDGFKTHYFWETSYYFGVGALILGLFGIIGTWKRREVAMLAVFAFIGFLFALGDNGPLYKLFYGLPLFGSFRNPARMMFIVIFAFSLLSGFGMDLLWQKLKDKKQMYILLVAAAIPLIIALMASSGSILSGLETPQQFISEIKSSALISLLWIAIVVSVAIMINRKMLNFFTGGTIIIIVAVVDLFLAGGYFNKSPQNPADKYVIDAQLGEKVEKFVPKLPDEIFRTSMRLYNPSYMAMARNQGLLSRIMLVEGYNPLVLARGIPPVYEGLDKEQARQRIHDMYNVKYEIGIDSVKGYAKFVERKTFFPRAWLVNTATVVKPDDVEYTMKKTDIDYRKEVVLEEAPLAKMTGDKKQFDSNAVKCTEYENNSIKYTVNCGEQTMLCLSEIWYPSWIAYVDSKEVKLYRANFCFRAVEVPAGSHEVVLSFESSTFNTGLIISLLSLGLGIVLIVFGKKKDS
jgi:hypothetical protein